MIQLSPDLELTVLDSMQNIEQTELVFICEEVPDDIIYDFALEITYSDIIYHKINEKFKVLTNRNNIIKLSSRIQNILIKEFKDNLEKTNILEIPYAIKNVTREIRKSFVFFSIFDTLIKLAKNNTFHDNFYIVLKINGKMKNNMMVSQCDIINEKFKNIRSKYKDVFIPIECIKQYGFFKYCNILFYRIIFEYERENYLVNISPVDLTTFFTCSESYFKHMDSVKSIISNYDKNEKFGISATYYYPETEE